MCKSNLLLPAVAIISTLSDSGQSHGLFTSSHLLISKPTRHQFCNAPKHHAKGPLACRWLPLCCRRATLEPDMCMQVIGPRRPGHAGEGFAKAALLADVSLLPEGPNQDPAGHRAVALATGYLDTRHDELVLVPRKQACSSLTDLVSVCGCRAHCSWCSWHGAGALLLCSHAWPALRAE